MVQVEEKQQKREQHSTAIKKRYYHSSRFVSRQENLPPWRNPFVSEHKKNTISSDFSPKLGPNSNNKAVIK